MIPGHDGAFQAQLRLGTPRREDLSALDELFSETERYRSSREYMELLDFVCWLRNYAPFNCMLLHIQNPAVSYVATAYDWRLKFDRRPKLNARPLVILQPFGPVMFVYDVADTDGGPVPDAVLHPFRTDGRIEPDIIYRTFYNCVLHGIEARHSLTGLNQAGMAIRLNSEARRIYQSLKLSDSSAYLILLNESHSSEEKYSSLAHELGHVFCGHLGADPLAWWESRAGEDKHTIELEAASVAYLVCRRRGLEAASARYLSGYRTPGSSREMPFFSLNGVFQAVDYIEKMGDSRWREPRRKPTREGGGRKFRRT